MQRWNAGEEPDRPWVQRRYRDQRHDDQTDQDTDDEVIDLTDDAVAAREINGRDFTILSRFRSRR